MIKRVFASVMVAVFFLTGCGSVSSDVDKSVKADSNAIALANSGSDIATSVPEPAVTQTTTSDTTATPEPTITAEPTDTPEPTETPEDSVSPTATEDVSVAVSDTINMINTNQQPVMSAVTSVEVLDSYNYKYEQKHDTYENTMGDPLGSQLFSGEYVEVLEKPYYVGKQDSSYLESVDGKYDEILYLNDKIYAGKDATVSDETVAKNENGFIIPLKQGLFSLTKDGETKRYAVTTFNDGKNVRNVQTLKGSQREAYMFAEDAEYWRQSVKTISDMMYYMMATSFCYTLVEPDCGWYGDGWTWCASGKSIHDYGQGVCAEIAQLAAYMLSNDFEDWGFVLKTGFGGHIYNWFYEDGKYYVIDYTPITGSNANGSNQKVKQIRDSISVAEAMKIAFVGTYTSVEEMAKGVTEHHSDTLHETTALISIGAMGHDYCPIDYSNAYAHDDKYQQKILDGTVENGVYFEECLKGNIDVLYTCGDNFTVGYIPTSDTPMVLRTCDTACFGPKLVKIR